MIKNKISAFVAGLLLTGSMATVSCSKETAPEDKKIASPVFPVAPNASFVEEFDTVGNLPSRGWVFKNLTSPIGQSGWRQGRYEATSIMTPTSKKGGFLGPVPFIGFPAYSAKYTPNDFISCDLTAVGDATGFGGNFSVWLISPQVPMKNNDKIVFYTRALDDTYYPNPTTDRMQVLLNSTDGTVNVGNNAYTTGSFTTVLTDINSGYTQNYLGGYPETWTKVTITLAGLPTAGIEKGRFAFRFLAEDAGLFGGSGGTNFPSVVGIDSLAFIHN